MLFNRVTHLGRLPRSTAIIVVIALLLGSTNLLAGFSDDSTDAAFEDLFHDGHAPLWQENQIIKVGSHKTFSIYILSRYKNGCIMPNYAFYH